MHISVNNMKAIPYTKTPYQPKIIIVIYRLNHFFLVFVSKINALPSFESLILSYNLLYPLISKRNIMLVSTEMIGIDLNVSKISNLT